MLLTDFKYFAKTGVLPFQVKLSTEFIITPQADGAVLRVVQAGYPRDGLADDFMRLACAAGTAHSHPFNAI